MNHSDEQWKMQMCNRMAEILHDHYFYKRGVHSRLFVVLLPDFLVTVGESVNGKQYREHIVPLCLIRDECINMFKNGSSFEEVAASLNKHVAIVRITFEEAAELNKTLKKTMPEGWVFNQDNIYARLDKVGIKYNLKNLKGQEAA